MTEQLLFWVFAILTCGGALAVVITQNVVRMAFWLVVSLGSVAALFFLLHADFLGAAQLLIYVGGTVVLLVFGVMLTASGHTIKIQTSPAEMLLGGGVGLVLLCVLLFAINSADWSDISNRIPNAGESAVVMDANEDRLIQKPLTDIDEELAAITVLDKALAKRDELTKKHDEATAKSIKEVDLEIADLETKLGEPNSTRANLGSRIASLEATKKIVSLEVAAKRQPVDARRQAGRTVRQLGLSFYGLRPDQNLNQEKGQPLANGYLLPFEIISIHLLVVLIGAAYLARAKRRATPGPELDL